MEERNIKQEFLEYLSKGHCGQENAVTSKELERLFHIKGSTVRQLVNLLRCESNPICSDATGYYYAETELELKHSIGHLHSRAMNIIKARNGLIQSQELFNENMQMSITEKENTTTH
ncbi:MAG: hypothetical protein EOL98_03655 [Negativicutes bacterium]|nr:hypothetical protein [Negativicutes bacterium]